MKRMRRVDLLHSAGASAVTTRLCTFSTPKGDFAKWEVLRTRVNKCTGDNEIVTPPTKTEPPFFANHYHYSGWPTSCFRIRNSIGLRETYSKVCTAFIPARSLKHTNTGNQCGWQRKSRKKLSCRG
jgi:hypothetical protein